MTAAVASRRGGAPMLAPVLYSVGVLVTVLGIAMLLPAVVDAVAGSPDWRVFVISGAVTIFLGVSLALVFRGRVPEHLSLRHTFLLTVASWTVLTGVAALPFVFSAFNVGYVDAFFEAMSGITTTGATVLVGLDSASPGILLWRALLQWLGGIGVVVMGVAVLPVLRIGGMQLLRAEWSETSGKLLPRAAELAAMVARVYALLTALCWLALSVAGMPAFDAALHALTTLSTGGFSTSDASIAHFRSAAVEWTLVVFMLCGGTSFTLFIGLWHGRARALVSTSQLRDFLLIVAVAAFSIALWRLRISDVQTATAIRESVFTVVSIVTTTGFTTADYGAWGSFGVTGIFILMFIGGCTGSTAGGVKVYRFQILFESTRRQLLQLFNPHHVVVAKYDGRAIPAEVFQSVSSFLFLYFLTFAVLALALAALGLDLDTALSAAASAIGNVGPGIGPIVGPTGNFAPLPDAAKLLLAAGMLLGRLELWTVLVLLAPGFWRA